MSEPPAVISPLRAGKEGSHAFAASAVPGPLFSGHPIPPLSRHGSLSMALILPKSIKPTSYPPSWALHQVRQDFKLLCSMLRAKMVGEPFEYERQLRLDGDAESLWAVMIQPRTRTSSRRASK
jgi:hypothetical protein